MMTQTSDEEIIKKRCPFCGALPHETLGPIWRDQLHGEPHQTWSFVCPHGCAIKSGPTKAIALASWNKRHDAAGR